MRTFSLLLAALTVGCGVPDDVQMSELEESQVESLCEELDGDRSVTCTYDEVELTIEISTSTEECIADYDSALYESCDATVGDMRACSDAWEALSDDEICSAEADYPAECQFLLECAFGR